MALFLVMQCTNAWAQIVVLVQFILDFGLHVVISILSWTISLLHRFYKRSRPTKTIVKRPLLTPRDALDLLTRVHHLFVPDQWVMPLPDQIMHVQAALQRTATRAEAQDKQLRHLRLELERSCRETLDQRALADSLRHELQHQKHLLDTAMSRISAMKSQNTGLASRVMAQNRRTFTLLQQVQKLEQEKVGHRAIMREVKCIKTLVTDGFDVKRDHGTCRTATTKRRGISSPEDGSYPSSPVKTTPTPSDVSLRTHLQDAQGYGYVPRPHPPPTHLPQRDRGNVAPSSPGSSIRAAKTEKRIRERIVKKIDAAISHCRAQGWFRDDFDPGKGDDRREKRVDSGAGLQSVVAMVYP